MLPCSPAYTRFCTTAYQAKLRDKPHLIAIEAMDKIGSGVEETMFDELIEDLRRAQTLKKPANTGSKYVLKPVGFEESLEL